MSKKRHTAEQIIRKLREAEVLLAQGVTVGEVCKKLLAEAALDKAILKEAASGNGSARQNDARPWSTCGMVWDGTESPSEGLAGFWASLARRSVATLTYRTTSHGWCETWSDWPPSTVGTATAVCPRCFAGKAGR